MLNNYFFYFMNLEALAEPPPYILWIIIIVLFVVFILSIFLLFKKINAIKSTLAPSNENAEKNTMNEPEINPIVHQKSENQSITVTVENTESRNKTPDPSNPDSILNQLAVDGLPVSASGIQPATAIPTKDAIHFNLSQARVQGHSHRKSNPPIPCQDYGKGAVLSNNYHVIIVSDGAGSSKLSHVASEFCVNTLFSYLQVFDFSDLKPNTDDPELLQKNWNKTVANLFGRTRNALLNLSKENNVSPTDLYCTLLLVIKTDWGFLSANIGDGRSGLSNGKPHALSVPLQTFTAGATFFLIKDGWENVFRSYIALVPDWSQIKYFFATTDGCQDFVMDHSQKGPRQGVYDNILGDEARYDYNVPYEPFFDGLIESLNEVDNEQERNNRLIRLIESGIYLKKGVETELKSISDPLLDDDKTIIIFHK